MLSVTAVIATTVYEWVRLEVLQSPAEYRRALGNGPCDDGHADALEHILRDVAVISGRQTAAKHGIRANAVCAGGALAAFHL
jgi:hypothetical protein